MSGNVHGHQLPKKGINVNPNNPVFGRHEPEVVPAEIPQGLHGAPALRSELENPTDASSPAAQVASPIAEAGTVYLDSDGKPIGVSDGTKITPIDLDKPPVREDGGLVGEEDDAEIPDAPVSAPPPPETALPSESDLDAAAGEQAAADATSSADQAPE